MGSVVVVVVDTGIARNQVGPKYEDSCFAAGSNQDENSTEEVEVVRRAFVMLCMSVYTDDAARALVIMNRVKRTIIEDPGDKCRIYSQGAWDKQDDNRDWTRIILIKSGRTRRVSAGQQMQEDN
jgi:hypothetical protein